MNWFEPVLLMCERRGAGGLAEPFNLVSNGLFFLVAFYGFWMAWRKKYPLRSIDDFVLAGCVLLMAVGSTIFHIYPTKLTHLIDFLPILFFIGLYFLLVGENFLSLSLSVSFLIATSLIAATFLGVIYLPLSSMGFLPAIATLACVGWFLKKHKGLLAGHFILVASGLFTLALLLRSIDMPLCDYWQYGGRYFGTHFLWHLLTGAALALLLRSFIYHRQQGVVAEILPPKL